MIHRLAPAKYVALGDEHHIGFRQAVKIVALGQDVGVHHTAVIARTPPPGALVLPLNFHIDFPSGAVGGQNVQPHRAVEQILHKHLRADVGDLQIGYLQNNAQDQLDTGSIPLKALCHEVVVQKPKAPQPLQILLMLLFHPFCRCHKRHPFFLIVP